jgi:CPA1 family monovalent cation:H+ antiporter
MTLFQTVALLLTFAALGAYVNHRFLKLPSTVGLMVFALLLSLTAVGLNSVGWVNLPAAAGLVGQIDFSGFLLHGILALLLFAGSLQIDVGDLKKHWPIVAVLATAGVIAATFITGSLVFLAAGWLGIDFPYIYALLFGALIAPTDPVAVLGILKEAGLSKNFRVKIASESLFNDGVGVVTFLVLLGMTQTAVPAPGAIVLVLAWQGLGAIILGLTLGWITYRLLLGIDDYKVEIMMTLALATGGYTLAEAVNVSAPIAIVAAGLFIGSHARSFGMSDKTRQNLDLFWELLDEILNAVLFMLMGLEMLVITPFAGYLAIGLMAILATLGGRLISVAVPVSLLRLRYRFERGTVALLTWGGLRGGISIALALSLPPGPERSLILGMTYIVVVFSVLFQGTTFRHIVRAIVDKNAR